jgi:hypothetical protein
MANTGLLSAYLDHRELLFKCVQNAVLDGVQLQNGGGCRHVLDRAFISRPGLDCLAQWTQYIFRGAGFTGKVDDKCAAICNIIDGRPSAFLNDLDNVFTARVLRSVETVLLGRVGGSILESKKLACNNADPRWHR